MRRSRKSKRSGPARVRLIYSIVFLSISSIPGSAQTKHIETFNQVWLGYLTQTRFSNKWGLWADFHLRTKQDFFNSFSQSVVRIGLSYYLDDAIRLTAGYAYVNSYAADNHKNVAQPEHRIWQQAQWSKKFPVMRMVHRVRLEERFRRKILNQSELGNGYNFNYRIRYNFLLLTPLGKKGFQPHGFSLVVNDEVLLNFGKRIIYNYFDQNRFFVGLSYQTNKSNNLQFGYMNLFQQLAGGNQYKSVNAARIFYFHNLDLRKK